MKHASSTGPRIEIVVTAMLAIVVLAGLLSCTPRADTPHASDAESASASDSAAVAAVIESYHKALAAGDSLAALALLAPDAVILEAGGLETREEYRGHHLPGDIEFARAVPSMRGAVRVVMQGDAAWAWSTSTTQGEFRGRAINSMGAELTVLSRDARGWRVRAIHWSSRTRRAPQ